MLAMHFKTVGYNLDDIMLLNSGKSEFAIPWYIVRVENDIAQLVLYYCKWGKDSKNCGRGSDSHSKLYFQLHRWERSKVLNFLGKC